MSAKTGPKLENDVGAVRARTYNVDELTERKLAAMGPTNRSKALRDAVRHYYAWWARQPDSPQVAGPRHPALQRRPGG